VPLSVSPMIALASAVRISRTRRLTAAPTPPHGSANSDHGRSDGGGLRAQKDPVKRAGGVWRISADFKRALSDIGTLHAQPAQDHYLGESGDINCLPARPNSDQSLPGQRADGPNAGGCAICGPSCYWQRVTPAGPEGTARSCGPSRPAPRRHG
jgi:hypothetical protein